MKNKWKSTIDKPEDDQNVLVSWLDSQGKLHCAHRAYYLEEEDRFFSLENNNSHPLHVDIWIEMPELPEVLNVEAH